MVAGSGLEQTMLREGAQIRVGEGHIGFAARKQLVMDAHDFRLESNLEREHIRRTSLAGVKADLCAPLVSNGRLLGAISMGMPRKWASVELKRLFGMVADVGALAISSHLQYREIRQLANSDPLTRIANKGYFMDRAAQTIEDARGVGRETAVLMIDVDHFKRFNDTYGHLSGDRVLRGIGKILTQHVREGDIAARFGGEEFIVLLRAADGETAVRVAERVRVAIRECDFEGLLNDPSQCVTASAGVSVFPEDGTQLGDLIGKADQALYEAKEHGRDSVRRHGQVIEDEEAPPAEKTEAGSGSRDESREIWGRDADSEGEGALDILSALQGAVPLDYADEFREEKDEPEDEGPAPLTTTILEMTTDASEPS
jgi:diguanylate cyclase (GGDEF)-like protein